MSNDTDTSTSTSSTHLDQHKRKSSKKLKRKSEKKHKKEKKEKRHKEKKRSRRNSTIDDSTPTKLPKIEAIASSNRGDVDAFGPALPPHLQRTTQEPAQKQIIGPVLPSNFTASALAESEPSEKAIENETACSGNASSDNDDLAGSYGPLPVATGEMSTAQIELEQRALELKLAAIEGASSKNLDQAEREEWMLELPAVGLKSGLAALSNMKRTFHHGKERPDFTDRSAWTKTPQSEANPQKASTSKNAVEALKSTAQEMYDRERDAEQELIAKKHKKKHKREESMVEIHQKKLRKEQRKKEKDLAASGAKPDRRPFSRDVDLKLNKIDSNQTKQIVNKAKILNTKFATGHTKYL